MCILIKFCVFQFCTSRTIQPVNQCNSIVSELHSNLCNLTGFFIYFRKQTDYHLLQKTKQTNKVSSCRYRQENIIKNSGLVVAFQILRLTLVIILTIKSQTRTDLRMKIEEVERAIRTSFKMTDTFKRKMNYW